MAKMCGNALRAFAAAFIVGLLSLSGASAQSGNPIRSE
jgi:diaminopimelate epimerase